MDSTLPHKLGKYSKYCRTPHCGPVPLAPKGEPAPLPSHAQSALHEPFCAVLSELSKCLLSVSPDMNEHTHTQYGHAPQQQRKITFLLNDLDINITANGLIIKVPDSVVEIYPVILYEASPGLPNDGYNAFTKAIRLLY